MFSVFVSQTMPWNSWVAISTWDCELDLITSTCAQYTNWIEYASHLHRVCFGVYTVYWCMYGTRCFSKRWHHHNHHQTMCSRINKSMCVSYLWQNPYTHTPKTIHTLNALVQNQHYSVNYSQIYVYTSIASVVYVNMRISGCHRFMSLLHFPSSCL